MVMSVYLIDLQFLSSFVYFFFMGVGIYEKETLASQGKYKSIPQTHCILTYPIVLYTWKDGTGHIHICNMYWIVLRILKPPELISLAVWFHLTGLYCFAPFNKLEVFFCFKLFPYLLSLVYLRQQVLIPCAKYSSPHHLADLSGLVISISDCNHL